VNSFVVSLLGLIPKVNIGEPAVIAAVIGVVATVRLQRRLHASRNLIVLVVTLLAYAAQFGYGVLLILNPHDSDQLINLSFIVFVTLILSLQRAWSLLKGKHLASAPGSAASGNHDLPGGSGPAH
jgi:EamA domain-containing membrane protein RarD